MRFIDLFCGLGGFHLALKSLRHVCVFACDIDEHLRQVYTKNFGLVPSGDLRDVKEESIPPHDILCAGFPCQPFSKAGEQLGTDCKLWGDLFSAHVLRVLRQHKPRYLLMENVANLERHDGGRTWIAMKSSLNSLGYSVDARVLSPHHFGVPQIRERLYIVGSRDGIGDFEWPSNTKEHELSIESVLDRDPKEAKELSAQVIKCLDAWQEFLARSPKSKELPSFPIWTMEFGATYPFTKYASLRDIRLSTLRNYRGSFGQTLNRHFRNDILDRVPSYARRRRRRFLDGSNFSFARIGTFTKRIINGSILGCR